MGEADQKMYRISTYRTLVIKEGTVAFYTDVELPDPRAVARLMSQQLCGADREHFVVLMMNAKNRPIGVHTASIGTLTASLVHPREVFKQAILDNAYAIILCHNHPSGDPTPSREDREVTERMIQVGKMMGIEVLDHIVLGEDGRYTSFRADGLIDF